MNEWMEITCGNHNRQLKMLQAAVETIQDDFECWTSLQKASASRKKQVLQDSICWAGIIVLFLLITFLALLPTTIEQLLPT